MRIRISTILSMLQIMTTIPKRLLIVWSFIQQRECRFVQGRVKCSVCLNTFLSTSSIATDTLFFSSDRTPRSYKMFVSPCKKLVHPNRRMYNLIVEVEHIFRKYRANRNCFDLIVREFSSVEIKLHFPYKEHARDAGEILNTFLHNYSEYIREFFRS